MRKLGFDPLAYWKKILFRFLHSALLVFFPVTQAFASAPTQLDSGQTAHLNTLLNNYEKFFGKEVLLAKSDCKDCPNPQSRALLAHKDLKEFQVPPAQLAAVAAGQVILVQLALRVLMALPVQQVRQVVALVLQVPQVQLDPMAGLPETQGQQAYLEPLEQRAPLV